MTVLRHAFAALLLSTAALQAEVPDLVLAIGGEPDTGFDPLLGWGAYGNPLFQSTLLKRDANLATAPDLATTWSLSEDRKVWTITLRGDARFADGSPVTAADVAFTFNTAKGAAGAVDLAVMVRAEAISSDTVQIGLDRPWITFAEAFYTLGIVPAAAYGPDYGRNPLGSGPFRMVSWAEGEQLIVAPNPYYYGAPSPFGQITFLFTGEDAGLAAAQAGVAHMVSVPAQLADAVPAHFHAVPVQTVDNRGLSLPFQPPHEVDGRNIGNAVTADPAIRRAINMGIDRDLLVEVALNGHGTPAFGPADGLPWAGAGDTIAYDLQGALNVLDAAGWQPGADGVRRKGALIAAFPINYPAGDATRQALAEIAAELLRPLGIAATPVGGSWDAIQRVMHAEPVVFGFGSHSPYQLYSLFAARLGGVDYMNPSYYANPAVDALFEQAQAAESLEASFPLWAAAAEHYGVAGDQAWAWLVNLDHVYLVSDCLDLGPTQIEPHGHGWPITASIANWQWTCN
ncbi:ABC transporter substrate-binding protein [Ketogulonicigenium vulgare]|uniref:ABC transporter substrate-binding protein n=1 Tax=Ketogulonicigenium vulgare TaxID=92945 RepID=UPI0001E677A8|nr:ABC transporter substrate-binding protein [Ketogulonicigenium vulgare]ADO41444.1 extracellular solute-binding protein family 5 [Ketogulonicigenium vulgare Y25]ALJ79926.1 nickel ABC transporter substrate-binding protein [Ketogulonicigenium vulgare]ANW32819.1 nickel ABC transporter substrate-binding protein [Ketogulonicigenium vulgare]AOZ53380.1 extracellular solute-binding protein family 5 [Ketogulonicigenium vulgare]